MAKCIFLEETITIDGHVLHRIQALETFKTCKNTTIHEGEVGGFIERGFNMIDDSWVGGNAKVFGRAQLSDRAYVTDNAVVYGNATPDPNYLSDYVTISGKVKICGNAIIEGRGSIMDTVIICDSAHITGGTICGKAIIDGYREINGGFHNE